MGSNQETLKKEFKGNIASCQKKMKTPNENNVVDQNEKQKEVRSCQG